MPRLALSTVHLAVREYWTAAAALIGLCILGESLSHNPPCPPDGCDARLASSLSLRPESGAGVSNTAYLPRGLFGSFKGLKESSACYLCALARFQLGRGSAMGGRI